MDAVNEAMRALKQTTLQGKKDQGVTERVDSLTTTLRLLDISLSSDSQIFEKLVAAVRKPFIPLYDKFPTQTFQLSAAIFYFLFHEKIVMQLTAGNKSLQSSWEDVAESLLSGVIDFLETRSDGVTLKTLASVLYPVLSRICFSTAFCSSITIGSTLKCTAFTLLVDSANEAENKEMLRDPEYLGSRRLGATLYRSKDYVILENLLLLVLIIAPKSEVMDKRSAFMREVFVANYPEDTICGERLAEILTKPTERDSDLIQAKAMDTLAQSNLMFPQPFDVTQINSCGLTFPQKPPQQRLIVDYKSLLANVIKDEGYESLRVSFDQIRGISFSAVDQKPFTKVVVQISSAPQIQLRPLRVPDGQSPHVMFEIREGDVLRFKRALRCRGVAVAPHISVSQEGPLLEFDRDGNPIPEVITSVRKVQAIEQGMQLSQRSDDSPKDKDDQDRGYCLLVNKSPGPPLVGPTILNAIPREATAATSSGSVSIPSRAPPDVTPPPRAPHQPSVFVPATPSQNRILREDVFGSGDTDLSDLSDDSEADSMKALSQKIAARSDLLITITKRASVLADAVFPVGPSGKKAIKRRVLDSADEEVLSSFRKGATDSSKPGVYKAQEAPPIVVVPNISDDVHPAPAPIQTRPKPTKTNPRPLVEKPESLIRDENIPKRKREEKNDDAEAGGLDSDVQEKPPPVKRARKTAGGKPGTTKPKVVSSAPPPAPPRDSQVLKKTRPATKKNANYGGRTKAARTSSPTRGSATLSGGDDSSDAPDLKIRTVDLHVEPPLVDASDDDRASSSPALPKPKHKSKAAARPKSTLAEKSVAPEKSKTTTVKAKAKTQAGTRTRVTVEKAKDTADEEVVRVDPPRKAKEKAKKKLEVTTAEEAVDMEGEEEIGMAELAKGSPAVIEVLSSPMEPPEAILPKRTPVSQVTSQQERVAGDATNTEKPTKDHPAPTKKVVQPLSEGDSRVEAVVVGPIEVIVAPASSPVRSTPTERRAKIPTKPISGQAFATSIEQRQDDRTSGCTEIGRQPVTELRAADELPLAQANPLIVVSGGVDSEAVVGVVKEAVVTDVQGLQDMDVEPSRFDAIVAMSPVRIPTGGITKPSPVRVREPVELEELRQLEMKPDNGEPSEGGTCGLTLRQPIMDRILVGISTPRERPWTSAGMDGTAQSTPAALPRGPRQVGQMPYGKQRVTFATTPFKEETVRSAQGAVTPRSGAQRRTIFEEDFFGMNSAWKRTPANDSDKHSALIEVLDEIQNVIVKKITHQFEVVEEEARFARNDVHNEALIDFKKMHSQRAVQFNALVDLETAYATRERELVVAYEALLAVNTEVLDHVRQKIREHDEKNLVGKLPKTIGKGPLSALMKSYLK